MKKSSPNICGKSQIVIFGIKFALCVAPAGGSTLESFQTFKNRAKIRKEIIKNHAKFQSEI